ncbi:probable isoaspartyl peptidase/L-asparaginase 3 isoform X2 [Amborella trichopoda]|uniref:probable isoaspartyl peptidase/L-asparaginase 3 isoform X2 n=1 Tax=Amborella trichopoda TaxID=13333 RepID=UPI0009BD4EFC|nr:probable isoaspartyl peptidase/L-asparaginase 3 isoform X2 [Amborella trichopoda]|eukprot:XP_011621176.2 probable isoaspartyl peptidase/L-asparaginase 3 isoform X2 [Amborella trichopoda]
MYFIAIWGSNYLSDCGAKRWGFGGLPIGSEHMPMPFKEAVRAAWKAVDRGLSALDIVVEGCSACEELRCDGTVGPGGSPDENGETTIDAMVMDGTTMEVGAVAVMRYVKDDIKAAQLVIKHTEHTLLVGEKASEFSIAMGLLGPMNLSSTDSMDKWMKWRENSCQPNFCKNVFPIKACGPYSPISAASGLRDDPKGLHLGEANCGVGDPLRTMSLGSVPVRPHNHDTISMTAIDKEGHIAVGTSTNGATVKIPGWVMGQLQDLQRMLMMKSELVVQLGMVTS